ncbi:TldD protein [Croceifilum oryzae]|uniref:TldD protein n=1 Tax=Croceifilum oryzae TaxID=1553429 RepID=A0AAJ1WT21_9BACL|nr:TldD/PmbA family protein [Croceifilum oryzae]MDQ0417983.1 TldD protein [Croceifilum oryzae]
MEHIAKFAIQEAEKLGVEYMDVRVSQFIKEEIEIHNGELEKLLYHEDQGIGIRVLVEGGWGFVSTPKHCEQEVQKCIVQAIELAKASGAVRQEKLVLSPVEKAVAEYRTSLKRDPFDVPLAEKMELLEQANAALRIQPEVTVAKSMMYMHREEKLFLNSVGSHIYQETTVVGAGIQAIASDGKDVQVRSYPNTFQGNFQQAGYEYIEGLGLVEEAERVAQEAAQLLQADDCPEGVQTLILHGSQLALQIHESCGHAVELDRALGEESGFVGESFLTSDCLGNFQYGSEIVHLTADATTEGGVGTYLYDDEGISAQRTPLVADGEFVGYLSGRDTAPRIQKESSGAMRAVGWQNVPIVRMTNVHLEPGDFTVEEIISTTESGIYMEGIKSWSIDDIRYNFQFGCEIAWEIKDGKRIRMLKNPFYTSNSPEFWSHCDAIAHDDWQLWGVPNCGKGEPYQTIFVSHGASTARFRQVQIGVS